MYSVVYQLQIHHTPSFYRATIVRQRLVYYYPIRGPELVIVLNMAVFTTSKIEPCDTIQVSP